MCKKKEQESIVQQLKSELGTGVHRHTMIGMLFDDYGYLDEKTKNNKEGFIEILDPFIERKLEKDYVECEDCGCLIAKDKALTVKTGSAWRKHITYCKHCKPPYDEILTEMGEDSEETGIGYAKNGVKCDKNGKIVSKLNK